MGAAAATLTGLMFVVITLMAGARIRVSTAYVGIATFNTPTVVHLGSVLLVAAIISVPWQALWQVSLALGLLGLGGTIYILTTVPQMRRMASYQPSRYDWIWYFLVPLVWYLAFAVAALVLPGHPAAFLYAIGAISVLLLFTGLHNAWDLIVYLAVERSHPGSDDRD